MCLNPQFVPNKGLTKGNYASEHGKLVIVPENMKSKKRLLQVPCGRCYECRANYFNSIKQRAIVESMSSYLIFCTLTCDDKHLLEMNLDGEKFDYIPYEYVQKAFQRLRDDKEFMKSIGNREFRYLAVMEYGDDTHRPHFHIIIFVAKKDSDTIYDKYFIEEAFEENLGKYYALNKGTRKHPIYERVYKQNKPYYDVKGKLRTNYYVKLVEGDIQDTIFAEQSDDSVTYVKTVQYLLGYVNKPDKYLQKIYCKLDKYKDKDPETYRAIKKNLICDIKYSKNFGSGFFTNGKKNIMEKISVRCSSNTYLFTEFNDNMPDTYEEFCDIYPDMSLELDEWLEEDLYSKYHSWNEFLNKISAEDYYLHMAYVKYFRKEFTSRFKSYFNKVKNGNIGYIYSVNNKKNLYESQKVHTGYADTSSEIYKFLRKGVEDGLRAKVPYLAFLDKASQKFVPLCKWYKDRVCTLDDTLRMYEVLGVKNYDEYIELFSKEISNYRALEHQSNLVKHVNCDLRQKPVNTPNVIKEEELYSKLIWNQK